MTIQELIAHLQRYYQPNEVVVYALWTVADVNDVIENCPALEEVFVTQEDKEEALLLADKKFGPYISSENLLGCLHEVLNAGDTE